MREAPDRLSSTLTRRILAVVDVGSNSIKGRVVDLTSPEMARIIEQVRYPVRLGRGVFTNGEILEEDLVAARVAFQDFAVRCAGLHVMEPVMAVGTSALREATNAQRLIDDVARHTGIVIRVISGDEEARLVALSAVAFYNEQVPHLVVDIGGGSTEIISADGDGRLLSAMSVPLGAVRLTQELGSRAVYTKGLIKQLRQRIEEEGSGFDLPEVQTGTQAIGTGGTLRAVLDMMKSGKNDIISGEQLEKLIDRLTGVPVSAIPGKVKTDPARAAIIVPGMVILSQVMKRFGLAQIMVRECGVRDGLIQEALSSYQDLPQHSQYTALDLWLGRVLEKYRTDPLHGQQVAQLCMDMFDGLASLHGLGDQQRSALYIAACLHDIGQFVGYAKHHKHSGYLLREEVFPADWMEWQEVIAATARYHRKSLPSMRHAEYADLTDKQRGWVDRMAAILRVADALDRQHHGVVKSLEARVQGGAAVLKVRATCSMDIEAQMVEKKAGLFRQVFDKEVKLEIVPEREKS